MTKITRRDYKDTIWDKIRYKYYDLVDYDHRPAQLWYRFKCWAWRRYTTVKPRYLPHTWVDRRDQLHHMMFEILSQFIERECSPGHVDWEGSGHMVEVNGEQVNVRKEMQDLYDWWHKVYMKEIPAIEDKLWKEAEPHFPDTEFVPIESSPGLCSMESKFKSSDSEQIYRQKLDEINKLERDTEEELQRRLHRLINIREYLWT